MRSLVVYLSGGMSNLSFKEQTKWRSQVKNAIMYGEYEYDCMPIFFDPTKFYSIESPTHKTEREPFEFDLNALRRSDLVIVNFNDPGSLGTAMELAIAYELRIPVVGLNKDGVELHPWLSECCIRVCDDMRELVDYVVEHYLQ